ncbi:MAG: hypothetical protein M3020_04525 [Myxococcota bacterium]|nr:hypothetical protein [Myxococcota bacterium]
MGSAATRCASVASNDWIGSTWLSRPSTESARGCAAAGRVKPLPSHFKSGSALPSTKYTVSRRPSLTSFRLPSSSAGSTSTRSSSPWRCTTSSTCPRTTSTGVSLPSRYTRGCPTSARNACGSKYWFACVKPR